MLCPNVEHNLSWQVTGALTPCNNIVNFPKFYDLESMVSSNEYKTLSINNSNNVKSMYCVRCWDKENSGLESKRLVDLKLDLTYRKIKNDYKKIDSALGDICNAACVVCGPDSSSLWQKFIPIKKIYNTSSIWSVCEQYLDKIVQLDFGGGEPWLNQIDQQISVFDKLITAGYNKYVKIRYNTNASLYPTKLLDRLINFREVEITLSIDDIEDRFEYNRWPLKWDKILTNIEQLKNLRNNNKNIKLTVNFTVSVFTWQRYQHFLDWANENDLKNVNANILAYPEIYSIKSINNKGRFENTLFDSMVGVSPLNNWDKLIVEKLDILDKDRNTNWRKIFPELV